MEGESDPVAPPDESVPAPPHAASTNPKIVTSAANRHVRGCMTARSSMIPRWRAAGRMIDADETDQDSLPMTRPTGLVPLPGRIVSQAEQHTVLLGVGFIPTEHTLQG